jgi:hypothetical protein
MDNSWENGPVLEPDERWLDGHPAPAFCLRMVFLENRFPAIGQARGACFSRSCVYLRMVFSEIRFPLFRIML